MKPRTSRRERHDVRLCCVFASHCYRADKFIVRSFLTREELVVVERETEKETKEMRRKDGNSCWPEAIDTHTDTKYTLSYTQTHTCIHKYFIFHVMSSRVKPLSAFALMAGL